MLERARRLAVPAAVLLVSVAALGGCAAPSKATPQTGAANDAPLCSSSKVTPDVLVNGALTKPGLSNLLTFALTGTNPSPPEVGTNVWTVSIKDASGNAAAGAAITKVVPFMPDHGHGSSITPQVAAAGEGFTVSNLYLFMPGLWQTTFTATADGGVTDSAVFSLCLGDG